MNADFLLDAVGLIDDDLILDAEAAPGGPRMGWVVLEDLLRRMYMDFDVWVV